MFLSLENPCIFLLVKEKTWKPILNTNSELSQNRTEKQIMPFKTTVNWLFNDTWCYLVIVCFDWKLAFFFKQLWGAYCILKAWIFSGILISRFDQNSITCNNLVSRQCWKLIFLCAWVFNTSEIPEKNIVRECRFE